MKQFTLYANGVRVDQIQVYGNDDAVCPEGWTDTTGQETMTLERGKALKCAEIAARAKSLRDKAISNVSAGEMASWPLKLAEAKAYAASANPADAPLLSVEAAVRGLTLSELIAKVDGNAQAFSALETQIAGTDGRHRDAVNVLTTLEDVAAYDYEGGWPEV